VPSFVRPFVGRTLHKFGGVLGAQVTQVRVPPDHAADCRERAAQVVSDLFDGYLRFKPFGQLATFFEVLVTKRVLFHVGFCHTKAAHWGGLVLLIIE
jgi:hypothetical protein